MSIIREILILAEFLLCYNLIFINTKYKKLVAVTYVSNIIGEGYQIEGGGLIYLQILAFML